MTVTRCIGQGLVFLVLWSLATVAVDASHTNERADPSVWIDPTPDDGYGYREDPCVRALLGAMAAVQPFLPTSFDKEDGLWHTQLLLTDDGMADYETAHRTWEETKVMCMR